MKEPSDVIIGTGEEDKRRVSFRRLRECLRGIPFVFGICVAAGTLGGIGSFSYAISGIGQRGIVPWVLTLPSARVIIAVSGLSSLAMAAGIVSRRRWGLWAYYAFFGYSYTALPIAYLVRTHTFRLWTALGYVGLSLTFMVYGWWNRRWFTPTSCTTD